MSEPNEKSQRAVRSYVVRGGRITAAQQRALSELWPRFGVDAGSEPLDLAMIFGRVAPTTVEIGFGNGSHLVARAAAEPERNFLGIEVHPPGVGSLLLAAEAAGVTNLRVLRADAVEMLQHLPTGSLDQVQILFPDPWPKKRHHKRRLIQPPFVALLASRLRLGGSLHLATDWEPYAAHMTEVLRSCAQLGNCAIASDYIDRPSYRAPTRFETRGLRLGHVVRDLLWKRVN